MKEKVLLFCSLLANWALVIGIKLENVTIPQYGVTDGSTTLGCYFDLEQDKLLVLKWYKDGHEFFRYSPNIIPSTLTFHVPGVSAENVQSNNHQVVLILRNLTLGTSGSYKCEVSADLPSFRTLSQKGDLIVVAPPRDLPQIDCYPHQIQPGDTLRCNCTSRHSKPAASLMFYLNDAKAPFGGMVEYPPVVESQGLETSILGLEFQVDQFHLKNHLLYIKCTASIGNGYWVSNVTLHEASINVNAQPSSPGHNRLLSGGSRGNSSAPLLTLFALLTILFVITSTQLSSAA